MRLNVLAIISGLFTIFLVGCGESSTRNSDVAKVTFEVDDFSGSAKKHKESGQVETVVVESIDGEDLGEAKKVGDKKYEISVTKGLAISIVIRLVNSKQGTVDLEKIIEEAKNEEVRIDQESTTIAQVIREEAKTNGTTIKEYIDSNKGSSEELRELIKQVDSKEYISNILKNIEEADSVDELAKILANAIKKLEVVQNILARIEHKLNSFVDGENSSTEQEGENESEDRLVEHFAGDFNDDKNSVSVNVNTSGEIIVTRDGDDAKVETDGAVKIKTVMSGEIKSVSADAVTLLVKADDGATEITFINDGVYKLAESNLKNLLLGEHISVKFIEEENKKFIRGLFGRGLFKGEVVEKGDDSLYVKNESGLVVKFIPRWINEGARENSVDSVAGNNNDGDNNINSEVSKSNKSGFDQDMLKLFENLIVGQKIHVNWILEEHKRAVKISREGENETGDNGSSVEDGNKENEVRGGEGSETEHQVKEMKGYVISIGENGFSVQESNSENTVVISMNSDIAFHKEILSSLVKKDFINVVFKEGAEKNVLVKASGEGSFTGELKEKTDSKIYLKNSEGQTVAFTPRWVRSESNSAEASNGGLDQEMLAKFASFSVGQKIKVSWVLDERKRAVRAEVVE